MSSLRGCMCCLSANSRLGIRRSRKHKTRLLLFIFFLKSILFSNVCRYLHHSVRIFNVCQKLSKSFLIDFGTHILLIKREIVLSIFLHIYIHHHYYICGHLRGLKLVWHHFRSDAWRSTAHPAGCTFVQIHWLKWSLLFRLKYDEEAGFSH